MSCNEHGCQERNESSSKSFIENQIICQNDFHTDSIIPVSYITEALEIEEMDLIKRVSLEMKIDKNISKVMESYQRFKSEFHEFVQKQVLKIESSQIEDVAFDAFILKLVQAYIINKGSYIS